MTGRKPANVVLILADDMGFADLGCMGSEIRTPNIDGHGMQDFDGESLAPLFGGADWTRERPIFWEHEGNAAVRLGEWKLVRRHGHAWELYNMEVDRTELIPKVIDNDSFDGPKCPPG